MKHILIVFLLLQISFHVHSQSERLNDYYSQNGFFVEILGRGVTATLNYERRIPITKVWKIGPQIGVGLGPGGPNNQEAGLIVPIGVTAHFGPKAHQIELGGGATFMFHDNSGTGVVQYPGYKRADQFGTLYLGYRYEQPLGGLILRIAYTPLFGLNGTDLSLGSLNIGNGNGFAHWAGISIGYAMPNYKTKKPDRPPY